MSFPVLFDDAAIFPPGDLPLRAAIEAHRQHRMSSYGDLVGPLVVGLSDVPDLEGQGPLDVAVVVPDVHRAVEAIEVVAKLADLTLVGLEVTDATSAALRRAIGEPEGVRVYLEIPRDGRRAAVIADLAGSGYYGKLRTGGIHAAMYPDETELAEALVALTVAGVPFKATAGLHHALRNTDPHTGFEQHGIVNLLAATQLAQSGANADHVAAALAERDAHKLPRLPATSLLRSIGTCEIAEPITELSALGLLTPAGGHR